MAIAYATPVPSTQGAHSTVCNSNVGVVGLHGSKMKPEKWENGLKREKQVSRGGGLDLEECQPCQAE